MSSDESPVPQDDPEHLPPGTVVGEYVLEDVLGAGGFARVYRAHHAVLASRVAVKVISRALALDAQASQRFVREARAASKIAHPGIVGVLGFGKLADGRAYQVMELIEGPALDDHLEAVGRLPLAEALRILEAIAAALDAAHAAGVVHRDLKPANVLMAPGPQGLSPRLADFGIATALEGEDDPRLTRTGTTLGTPTYMSPEQALGRQVGPASDVYSFGVLAFELITGRLPFAGESTLELMMHHVQTEAPAPSAVDPALGPSFDAALAAMLAKRPAARPVALAEALRALRAGGEVPRSRRGRRPVVAASVVVVVVAAVTAALWWRGGPPEAPTAATPSVVTPATVAPVTVPSTTVTRATVPSTTVPSTTVPPIAPPSTVTASRLPVPARSAVARPARALPGRERPAPASPAPEVQPAPGGPTGADSLETPSDYSP